jgi:hypothetical protein
MEAVMKVYARWTLVAIVLALAACATQPAPPPAGAPGFWLGLVQGFIAPVALIASLFTDVRIYAFPNAGGWYDLGYFLGIAAVLGGGGGFTITVRSPRRTS